MSEFKEKAEQLMPSSLSKDNFTFEDPIFQYYPAAMLFIDQNGKVLTANPQFSQFSNYPLEELQGKMLNTFITFSEDDYRNYISYMENPIQEVRSLEAILNKKDYTTIEIEISGYPLFTAERNYQGYILAFKDISSRKVEEKLNRVLFNISRSANTNISLPDLYDIIHKELNQIIFAENFHIALWDKEKDQTIFPYFIDEKYELAEESDKPSFLKSLANYIIENGKPLLVDYAQILKLTETGQLKSADREKLTEETCWLGVPLKIGIHLTGCLSVVNYSLPNIYSEKDINSMKLVSEVIAAAIERKIAEKEIHQNHEKFVSLFTSNPLAAVYSDTNHIVRDINPKFTEVFGYTREDIIGKHIEQVDFFPPGKKMEGKELLKDSYHSFLKEYETYRRTKEGRDIPVQLSASPVRIKDELQGFISLYNDITEKKLAEEVILQDQERFESLFKSNPLAALFQDKEGIILDINPRFTELFGYTREDILGKNIDDIDLYPLEKIEEGRKFTKKAFFSPLVKFETIRKSKEGRNIPIKISTSQVEINGQTQGVIALYEDISEKKRDEEIILQNQEKFISLFSSNPLASVYTDVDDRVLDINPQFTRLFGYTRKEILGKKLAQIDFYPPGKKEEGEELTRKASRTTSLGLETIRRTKDGRNIPVQISNSQVKIKSRVLGVMALYEDITEKKQAEEEIRQNKERFESLFRSNPLAAVYLDKEDRVLDANPQFTKLFGYAKKDILGKKMVQFNFYPQGKKEEGEGLTKKTFRSPYLKFETIRRTKDGRNIPVQISSSQMKIKGLVRGVIGLYEDITQKKQAEEEIRQNKERFESLFRSNPLAAVYLDKEDRVLDANPQFTLLFGFTREEMLGKRLVQLNFYPLDKIKEGEELTVKAHSLDFLKHETYRRTKRGRDIPVQLSTSQVKIKGQTQGFIALYQDITKQKQNEALQQVLYNISQAANSSITLAQLYRNIHTELKRVIHANNFYIALLDQEKNMIFFVYYCDELDDDFSSIDINLNTITSYLIKQQQSLLLNYEQMQELSLKNQINIQGSMTKEICWLGVPLKIEGRVIGAIVLQNYHNPICYSENDIKLMEMVAAQVATALNRKLSEEKIIYISFHDSLTGLYNRAYFEEELKRMNHPRFYPLTVVMMDVNGIKAINDTFGHSQGDQLLKNLAVILNRNSREVDVLARLGGDEFAIILPNTTGSSAEGFCQRIINDCQQNNFEPLYLNPNISMGFATQEGKLSDYETILREADQRMYQNKLLNVKSREKYLLDAFLSILTARDVHTEKHAQRIVNIAYQIGLRIGLSPYDLDRLRLLALLHDIGKIGVPENILFKVEPLIEADWQILKNHTDIGYRIAKNIPDFSSIANEILYHHERWDGTGYPAGLKGKEIPLLSRIIALVDAFDAMQSIRCYKKPLSQKEALEEIKANAGTQFDPELVKIFFEVFHQKLLK